jgi:hypothetical protein
MHCEGKLKLRSHNTSYCLIGVVTKAGSTVFSDKLCNLQVWCLLIEVTSNSKVSGGTVALNVFFVFFFSSPGL